MEGYPWESSYIFTASNTPRLELAAHQTHHSLELFEVANTLISRMITPEGTLQQLINDRCPVVIPLSLRIIRQR